MSQAPIFVSTNAWGLRQDVYRFPNGWGASVVVGHELAVTRPVDEHPDHFYLVEDDPLVQPHGTRSYSTDDELTALLDEIASRPWAGIPDLTERWQSDRE